MGASGRRRLRRVGGLRLSGRAALTAFLTALLVSACGGTDEGPTSEEFAKRANAVCQKAAGTVERQSISLFGPGATPSREEMTRFLSEVLVPATRQQVAELRRLEPPRSDREEFEEFLVLAGRAVDGLERRLREDPDSFFREPANPFAEVNEKAVALGLEGCTGGTSSTGGTPSTGGTSSPG